MDVSAAQLQLVMDKAAGRLQPWSMKILNHGGRSTLKKSTLSRSWCMRWCHWTSLRKLLMLWQNIPEASSLWKGHRDVKGENCVVAWDKVASLRWPGGLGIPNLCLVNHALIWWRAWLERVDPARPWAEFDLRISWLLVPLFELATEYVLGNGERALFWAA